MRDSRSANDEVRVSRRRFISIKSYTTLGRNLKCKEEDIAATLKDVAYFLQLCLNRLVEGSSKKKKEQLHASSCHDGLLGGVLLCGGRIRFPDIAVGNLLWGFHVEAKSRIVLSPV